MSARDRKVEAEPAIEVVAAVEGVGVVPQGPARDLAHLGVVVIALMVGAAASVQAFPLSQSGTNLERPPGWEARYDAGDVEEREHVVMRPGWHVHPGPAGIFWDPGRFAEGDYGISSTIFLFPPAEEGPGSGDVSAPYGIIAGGSGLDGPAPEYVSFLVRNDGSYRVAHHLGDEVHEIVPWTPHEAVNRWTEGAEGTARNDFFILAGAEEVQLFLNDRHVESFPRSDMALGGMVGLRAGEGLSLHVTEISIGAPRREQ